ncbi:hypothetical protein P692DRAFT_20829024 [Suillus brevipes Sb2]|nr:hypothetical protein P692DRAFT_20829024 [Suillus brevipes Sb2]
MRANATVDSHQLHDRHGVYRPELRVGVSQDTEFHKSQDTEDAVLHITQPVQDVSSPTGSTMYMKSSSLA